jgi:hypothetical protein
MPCEFYGHTSRRRSGQTHLGGASVNLSHQLLNRTGTLVCYSIASKRDDTGPVLPGLR